MSPPDWTTALQVDLKKKKKWRKYWQKKAPKTESDLKMDAEIQAKISAKLGKDEKRVREWIASLPKKETEDPKGEKLNDPVDLYIAAGHIIVCPNGTAIFVEENCIDKISLKKTKVYTEDTKVYPVLDINSGKEYLAIYVSELSREIQKNILKGKRGIEKICLDTKLCTGFDRSVNQHILYAQKKMKGCIGQCKRN